MMPRPALVLWCAALVLISWLFVQAPMFTLFLLLAGCFVALFFWNTRLALLLFWLLLLFQGCIAFGVKSGLVYVLDEMGIACMMILLPLKVFLHKQKTGGTPIDLPLFGLLIMGAAGSLLHAVVPPLVAGGGVLLLCKGFVLFYVFCRADVSVTDMRRFKTLLYAIGVLTLLYGILGAAWPRVFLHPLGVGASERFGLPALQSFLGHPGSFSAFMGILCCFAFSDSIMERRRGSAALVIVFLTAIIFSLRRTTLIGVMLAALFVFASRQLRRRSGVRVSGRLIITVLLVCLSSSGVLFVLYRDLISSYMAGESPRSLLLVTGLRIAADYFPFGSGFGTYSGGMNQKFYSPLFYKYRLHTVSGLSKDNSSFINDTFWPHIVAETGVFGFVCYALIIAAFFRVCFAALRRFGRPEQAGFALTALMMLIVSLVESTKATFYEMSLWTFFYFGSVGVLHSWLAKENGNEHSADK